MLSQKHATNRACCPYNLKWSLDHNVSKFETDTFSNRVSLVYRDSIMVCEKSLHIFKVQVLI